MIVARHGSLLLPQIGGVKTWYLDVPAAWVILAEERGSVSGECRSFRRLLVRNFRRKLLCCALGASDAEE